MYRKILIATDGSELAGLAVNQGIELARKLGAEVAVVTVTDRFPTGQHSLMARHDDVQRYEQQAAKWATEILERVREVASELGIACTTRHVADEYPAHGILKASRDCGCDLIVMATHGRRGLDRLLLGSQASKVLAMSQVAVLVCR